MIEKRLDEQTFFSWLVFVDVLVALTDNDERRSRVSLATISSFDIRSNHLEKHERY